MQELHRLKIFLTGATGLLGGELLLGLSRRPEVESIACLVRGEGSHALQQRLRRVFLLQGQPFPEHKVLAVPGNLLDDNLSERLANHRDLRGTHLVVHAAANTSFLSQNEAIIQETNVAGMARLLRWVEGLPDLHRFVHVSTASLCGRDLTHRNVMEDESPDPSANQLVSYTASKVDAEILLRRQLPAGRILIVRPSILFGDSRGWATRADPVLWAVAAINRLRLIPIDAHAPLDMVPVDYAATAIIRLLFANRHHDVYHVSSGPERATSAAELATALSESFAMLPKFRFVPSSLTGELANRIRGRSVGASQLGEVDEYLQYWTQSFGNARRALTLLSALRPYFRFIELGQTFDNARLLGDTGMEAAPSAHVYVRRCMRDVADVDVLGGALDP